jgi:peptidyl-prolyl cis-trans isomerase B (cyclophilin B)
VAGKKERQRRLERERYQRRLDRRAQHDAMVRRWSISGVVGVIVLAVAVGVFFLVKPSGGKASAASTPAASASGSASATASAAPAAEPATHCSYTKNPPAARSVGTPPTIPDSTATYQATINTNRGAIVINLLNSKATCTVNSFVFLAQKNYFNKTPCPRLSTTGGLYILQCGDPTGTGSGGPGYEFASENLSGATYPAGTLAMANTGAPDSNGSQFFLVYKATDLPPSYTPFGHVADGLNILQNIANAGVGPPANPAGGGKPKESVEIESVTIKKS